MQAPTPRSTDRQNRNPAGNRVVLIGASVRAASEAAKRAGFHVVSVDFFGDSDTRAASDQWIDLKLLCQKISTGAPATSLVPTGEVLFVGDASIPHDVAEAIFWAHRKPGSVTRVPCLSACRDPAFLDQICAAAALPIRVPEWQNITEVVAGQTPDNTSHEGSSVRRLVKPRATSGGIGIEWFEPGRVSQYPATAVVQRWIPGRVYGAVYLCGAGRADQLLVSRALTKRVRRRDPGSSADRGYPFHYAGSFGPIELPRAVTSAIDRLARTAAESGGLVGLINLDFIVDPGGDIWLLEINPRWSASCELIDYLHRRDGASWSVFEQHYRALGGSEFVAAPTLQNRCPVSKRIVYSSHQGVFQCNRLSGVARLPGDLTTRKNRSRDRVGTELHDVPVDGVQIEAGQPLMTVLSERLSWQNEKRLVEKIQRAVIGDQNTA